MEIIYRYLSLIENINLEYLFERIENIDFEYLFERMEKIF